jgi:hypothetical protein
MCVWPGMCLHSFHIHYERSIISFSVAFYKAYACVSVECEGNCRERPVFHISERNVWPKFLHPRRLL